MAQSKLVCIIISATTAYTSPIKALDFLEGHAQEVDMALVAVHMEEMHGFQFLDVVREDHKNIQVISNGEEQDVSYWKESAKTKKGYICWNDYLHRKFLHALEILGEGAASPRNIEILMNVEGVNRKHISSHLQKYRKRMEAGKLNSALDATKCRTSASKSESAKSHQESPNNSPDIQQEEMTADEDMPHAQMGSFSDNNAHAAMRRSIQFSTMYDESQYLYFSSSDGGVDMMEDRNDDTCAFGFSALVSAAETFSADGTKEMLNNNSSEEQDCQGDKVGKAVKLVEYSDSEADEI
ncbi:two-component response regulator ORR29 [Setaria viridis]|uniref:two-component response regulator ORR29 n=1 Tax=Setaria viridis TaxID=4556 RepID=UPI003B3BE642